ncbi:MAG: exodeoxyribonuclease VII large subunit [Dehalococcoidia bacterium]
MLDLTVSQILNHIEVFFENDEILSDVVVVGEVSRVSTAASGHSYFTLKDEESLLDGVIFNRGIGSENLLMGEMVRVFGRIAVYKAQGRMQIVSNIIQPAGSGTLQSQIDDLKKKLDAEGLFDHSRKRTLPNYPVKIGIVTSEDAAAWGDIKRTISTRFPLVEVILAHTLVQGDKAPRLISEALYELNKLPDIDVIILARGGGSPEDLMPFNDELVARAIFSSLVPVVTGIGHEDDWTISDYVADFRAATPTAASVAVVPDFVKISESIGVIQGTLNDRIQNIISETNSRLKLTVSELNVNLPDFDNDKLKLDDLVSKASNSINHVISSRSDAYKRIYGNLHLMSPQATLERGYSIVHKPISNKVITKKSDVTSGDLLKITISDGDIDVVVED